METRVRKPKPGIILLNGMVKIEKFDSLNYTVKVKDENAKDKKLINKKNDITYIYETDGFSVFGTENYFGTVTSAIGFVIDRVVPTLVIDGNIGSDEVNEIESIFNQLILLKDEITEKANVIQNSASINELK